MKKVISFSVYGSDPKYTIGALRNLQLSKHIYPDWDVYLYYNNTVPLGVIQKYKEYDHVTLFDMTDFPGPGVLWRFLPKEGVERFISRDTDSRLNIREKYAIDEWIESGKKLHIMRDHPHHGVEMHAGLFGLVLDETIDFKKDIISYVNDFGNLGKDLYYKNIDRFFLMEYVYKFYKDDMIAHDSFFTEFPHSKPFPKPMENYNFIGEIFDSNDNRYPQYIEWINKKELR